MGNKALPAKPGPFVRLFEEEAPSVLDGSFQASRCLNATRICIEVMRAFNVRAWPLSVGFAAFNRRYVERLARRRDLPDREELDAWIADGAWALGIETRPENALASGMVGWPGHLVAIVQDGWIVDGAAGQFNRPAKGIEFPGVFVAPVSRDFLRGRSTAILESSEGAQVVFNARLDDRSWESIEGFQLSPHNADAAEEIANRIAARIGRKGQFRLQA